LLGARLGARPESVELAYGPQGKPALAPRFAESDLRFNVSHCDDVAAYVFVFGREIGVDIEAVRPVGDADDLAARFFSDGERAAYEALDPPDRPLDSSPAGPARRPSSKRWAMALVIHSIASMSRSGRTRRRGFSGSGTCLGTAAAGA